MHKLYSYFICFPKCFCILNIVFFLTICASCKQKQAIAETNAHAINNAKPLDYDEMKFKTLFFEASKEKMKNNVEKAYGLFKEALVVHPNSDAVNYELANITRSFGKYEESIVFGKAAKAKQPFNEWYRLLLIDNYHTLGKYKESSEEARSLVSIYPKNKNFYLSAAQEYLFAKNLNASLDMYNQALKQFGKDENIEYNKVQLLMDLKRYTEAEDLAITLFRDYPRNRKYFNLLEELYKFTNQKGKALKLLESESIKHPEDPYLHLALADYYRQEKQEDKAFKEISSAFESQELEVGEKLKILVSFYNMTEKYPTYKEQGMILCQKMISAHPKEGKANAIYGDFLIRDQKLKEAVEQYTLALQSEKENYFLWSQLLILNAQLNDIETLLKNANEAVELFPNQPVPYYFKGFALNTKKDYQPAIDALLEGNAMVVENKPLSIQFLSTLGDAYNSIKDYQNSERHYDSALLLDPNNEYVLNNYAYYLSLRKDKLAKAEKMSKLTLDLQPENVNYLDTYAWILFQQSKFSEAKPYILKAVQSPEGSSAIVLEHCGDIHFKLNENEEALRYWEMASKKGGASELIEKKLKEKKYYE